MKCKGIIPTVIILAKGIKVKAESFTLVDGKVNTVEVKLDRITSTTFYIREFAKQ